MSKALYEITEDLMQLQDALMRADVEEDDVDAMEEHLQATEQELVDKAEGYWKVITNLRVEADTWKGREDAVREEYERLRDKRKALENKSDGLKQRLADAFEILSVEAVDTELGTLRLRQHHSPSVQDVQDVDALPEKFQRVKVSADKRAIADAAKEGDPDAMRYVGAPKRWVQLY